MKTSGIILVLFACIIAPMHLSAQKIATFSSLGASLSAGTTGVEFELAVPLHNKLFLRGGFSFLPYNFDTSVDVNKINDYNLFQEVTIDLNGKIRVNNGKILLDFFPGDFAFFVSGGIYWGKEKILSMKGKSDVDLFWGEHIIPSVDGHVKAVMKVNNAKPYLGIGFGNAVPNRRVGFRVEAGAMFQGTPKLYNIKGDELDDININDKDVIDFVSKFKIYPVVAFRLTGRIF